MFKSTGKSGLRRSGGAPSQPRVSGIPTGIAGAPLAAQVLRRPAFLPELAEEQTFDSSSPRLSEPGRKKQGYTGSNIGA